jgi:hypothetical protein
MFSQYDNQLITHSISQPVCLSTNLRLGRLAQLNRCSNPSLRDREVLAVQLDVLQYWISNTDSTCQQHTLLHYVLNDSRKVNQSHYRP